MKLFFAATFSVLLSFFSSLAPADLVVGPISDFQDGTVQGWAGGTVDVIADSGPSGSGDFSARLSNGGVGNRFAMFNLGVNGTINSEVTAIQADILRPTGEGAAELRLVLFDTDATRWTSTASNLINDGGNWNRFSFSILESDLTRVQGAGNYASLTGNLQRIMFRYDPGAPSAGGAALNGSMRFDNISAVPEASGLLVVVLSGLGCFLRRRPTVSAQV